MTEFDKFLYRVASNGADDLRVKIGYYNPRAYKRQDGGYDPGFLFGFETEVEATTGERWNNELKAVTYDPQVRVMQRGNSLVTIEEAEMRAEVNRQALQMAHYIQNALTVGESTIPEIAEYLTGLLHSGEPVDAADAFEYVFKSKEIN